MKKTFNPSYLQFKHDMVECALEYLGNSWWESLKTSKINNIIYAKALIHCSVLSALGPLYTRDWEPMTIALQALSLVEKAELVEVCFTLCLRDQWSIWMQDGCKVYKDSYMVSSESYFMVSWIIFQKPPLGGRPNTKSGDHGTPNDHNRWFILFIMCEDPRK
jgi:hypothetical protein